MKKKGTINKRLTFESEIVSPFRSLIILMVSVFGGDMLVMYILDIFDNEFQLIEMLIDASLLTILVYPVLLLFVIRPIRRHISSQKKVEEKLLEEIYKHEQTEEALRICDNKNRKFFDSFLYGYAIHEIILDKETNEPIDYRFLEINQAFDKHTDIVTATGLKIEDIIGKTVLEILPKTERHWIKKYGEVALSGKSIEFEAPSQTLGKHYRVMAFQNIPGQFAVIFSDITKQKEIEEKLKEERKNMELALIGGDLAWWNWNLKTDKILYERSEEVIGFKADQLEDYYRVKRIHPDDVEENIKIDRKIKIGEMEKYNHEYRITTDTGDIKWISEKGRVLEKDQEGKPLRAVGTIQDITARKKNRKTD